MEEELDRVKKHRRNDLQEKHIWESGLTMNEHSLVEREEIVTAELANMALLRTTNEQFKLIIGDRER